MTDLYNVDPSLQLASIALGLPLFCAFARALFAVIGNRGKSRA